MDHGLAVTTTDPSGDAARGPVEAAAARLLPPLAAAAAAAAEAVSRLDAAPVAVWPCARAAPAGSSARELWRVVIGGGGEGRDDDPGADGDGPCGGPCVPPPRAASLLPTDAAIGADSERCAVGRGESLPHTEL